MKPFHHSGLVIQLATEFVNHTSHHIFLTGKAGTGKTTFLRQIRENCIKNMVVVAPTGVAAINAGGVTAHSFFQLPLGSYYPGSFQGPFHSESAITDRHHLLRNLQMNSQKRDLINSLELLIIDEVSMLRCDMLDAIDVILRTVRRNQREPFGGVQVLLIGDLFQLPPVARDNEWALLREFYASPFFFEARVLQETTPVFLELTHVYRQSDEDFIHLLNRIRNNEVEEEDLLRLQRLWKPGFRPPPGQHYITLTTHNKKADEINSQELKRLAGKEFYCQAVVGGDFPDRNDPVERSMRLKPGSQVMFVRNDTETKKYFNGKIGVLKSIDHDQDDEFITVEFPETQETIEVRRVTWHHIRYQYRESENRIYEEELGSFTQYPIRLAWAVTIHKSQGLTFQRAVIDAGQAFAPGQVYVALSRCVSLEGIVLLSQIPRSGIMTDPAIVDFMNRQPRAASLRGQLESGKQSYFLQHTLALFDLQPLISRLHDLILYLSERKLEQKDRIIKGMHSIAESVNGVQEVADRFRQQIQKTATDPPAENPANSLPDRVNKAKAWFEKELDAKVAAPFAVLNKAVQQMNKVRTTLREMKGFSDFLEHFIARYSLDPQKRKPRVQVPEPVHEADAAGKDQDNALYNLLRRRRSVLSREENIPPFLVCHDSALKEMSSYFPQDAYELSLMKGMGDKVMQKYGDIFLEVIREYCLPKGIASRVHEKRNEPKKKKGKKTGEPDTKTRSLLLFREGKNIRQIAEERGLAQNTIEGHLAFFVKTGDLDVRQLVTAEKLELIRRVARQTQREDAGPIKNILGEAVSYSEIRFALNSLRRNRSGGNDAS